MEYKEERIYEALNKNEPLSIVASNKEDYRKELRQLNLVMKWLPLVSPINYSQVKEENPERFSEIYDAEAKRPTLEGFKEELRELIKNNQSIKLDAKKKLIKNTEQYNSYKKALDQIEKTFVQTPKHTTAETFNYLENNKYMLMDNHIIEVKKLLEGALATALELQVEPIIVSPYINGDSEAARDIISHYNE